MPAPTLSVLWRRQQAIDNLLVGICRVVGQKSIALGERAARRSFVGLLFGTLAVALVVIYSIASVRSGDWTWRPLANDRAIGQQDKCGRRWRNHAQLPCRYSNLLRVMHRRQFEFQLLLLGSEWSVYWPEVAEYVAAETALIREAHRRGIPQFGICFGNQSMAHALGGTVERARAAQVPVLIQAALTNNIDLACQTFEPEG